MGRLLSSLDDIKSVGPRETFTGIFQAIQPELARFSVDLSGWHTCSITGNHQHPISGTLAPGASQIFPGPVGRIWNNRNPDPGALYNPNAQLVSYFNS